MERALELPDVGEGIAEGEIVQWLVEPGDAVTEDQALAEVETDKAVVEVPSPVDGTVLELHAEEGEVVAVGTVIVTFEVDESPGAEAEASPQPAATVESGSPEQPEGTADAGQAGDGPTASGDGAPAGAGADSGAGAEPAEDGAAGEPAVPASRVVASPRVKRLARELGVDIGAVEGAAAGARITETDVRRAAGAPPEPAGNGDTAPGGNGTAVAAPEPGGGTAGADPGASPTSERVSDTQSPDDQQQAEAVSPGGGAAEAADRERTLAAPATRRVARDLGVDIDRVPAVEQRDGHAFVTEAAVREFAQADAGAPATRTGGEAAAAAATPEPAGSAGAAPGTTAPSVEASAEGTPVGEERIPYRGIRRTIGQRMEQSKYTAPHVTHHDSTPVSGLVDLREQLKPEMPEDVSLTYLPFVMKAVVAGLREYPAINATLDTESEEIVQKKYYNLGVATATDAGLMVPVVDNVGEKGIVELARETGRLVERARSREIAREEMQGGTFTITNFGAIGGDHATPIINYPEAAILGLGAIKERPVAEDGEVIARTTLPLSLSVDHRLIDGAVAAGFTNEVKRHLNNPSLLMLW